MIKRIFVPFVLIVSQVLVGQELKPVYDDSTDFKSSLHISSFNYYSSNRFSNDLMDKFIMGGEITSDIKDRNQARLGHMNQIGAEIEQEIYFQTSHVHPFKKKQYGLLIGLSDNHFMASNIASGLFNLGLYGNTSYLGDSLVFPRMSLRYQHYQKFRLGLYDRKTRSSISVGYVFGSRGIGAEIDQSYFYSDSSADSLALTTSGTGFQTNQAYPYAAFQGNGFSFDLNLNFTFDTQKGLRQVVNLKINNVGVIFWNKNSQSYRVNNTINYTGFEFSQLIDDSNELTYDLLDTIGYQTETGFKVDPLPLEITVQKLADRKSPNKLQAIFGVKSILVTAYTPYVFIGGYFQPKQHFSASARLSYGGFGGFQAGSQLNFWTKNHSYFYLSTHNLIGLVSEKFGMGRSLNFGLNLTLQ